MAQAWTTELDSHDLKIPTEQPQTQYVFGDLLGDGWDTTDDH